MRCFICIVVTYLLSIPVISFAQNNCVCAICGRDCNQIGIYGHVKGYSCYVAPISSSPQSSKSSGSSTKQSTSGAINGMIIQSLFNAALSSDNEAEKKKQEEEKIRQVQIAAAIAQQKRTKDSLDYIAYKQLMKMSKTLPDGDASLDFKNLNGDAEKLSSDASKQFSPHIDSSSITKSKATNFFGIPLSDEQNMTLLAPENDPVYLDLNSSIKLSKDYLKEESKPVQKQNNKTEEKPKLSQPECDKINHKLEQYRSDLFRFEQWNTATVTDLNKWKDQNNDAFWNAVKDGASAAFGVFADYLKDSRESAAAIKKVLEANEEKYLRDKVFTPEDIIKYKKMLDDRTALCNSIKLAKEGLEPWDYVKLARNLLHGTVDKLASSDGDCRQMINMLKDAGLSESPFVDAAQFLAEKTINTFLEDPSLLIKPNSVMKGLLKVPYTTIIQLAIDETYNATDWWLSYKNLCTLRDADGKATAAVKKLQNDMNTMKIQLNDCPIIK